MRTLKVQLPQNSYSIHISAWDLTHTAKQLQKICKENILFIVTNHKIRKLYQKKIQKHFKSLELKWISIPDGERYKNLTTCEKILTQLTKKGAHRGSTLMALGGGVVGDITGFVAATYMRGIAYVQMPTTLLAQVDSSVGGKTGVDLSTGKNLVGAFYQPRAVFIHTDFLKTLNKREFRCGLAEVIKYGIIWDAKFFSYLKKNAQKILNLQPQALGHIIKTSCQIKAQVVKKDEKEQSLRAILNFGHTLGHAIEAATGFHKIKHGEAVAMGMVFAAKLSHQLQYSHKDHSYDVMSILKLFSLPTQPPKIVSSLYLKAMRNDKKSTGKNIKFILIKKIGKVDIVPLTLKEIQACL